MKAVTQRYFTGDEERCLILLKRAEIMISQMEELMDPKRHNGVHTLSRTLITTDGDRIFVKRSYNINEVWIFGNPDIKKEEEAETKDVFLVLSCQGARAFRPLGYPGEFYKQIVVTQPYYIVFKLRTRAYARIQDMDSPKDINADISFPCRADKIVSWTQTTELISKEDPKDVNSNDLKVWNDPTYYIPGTSTSITHADDPAFAGCGCNFEDWNLTNGCIERGYFRGYQCSSPKAATASSGYDETNAYLGTGYRVTVSCTDSGSCRGYSAGLGRGGSGVFEATEQTSYTTSRGLIGNGTTLPPDLGINYFGSGFLSVANNSIDKATNDRPKSLFSESSIEAKVTSEVINEGTRTIDVYIDPNWNGSGTEPNYYVNSVFSYYDTTDDRTTTLEGYSPIGSVFVINPYNNYNYHSRQDFTYKNYFSYSDWPQSRSSSENWSRDKQLWLDWTTDINVYNNYRRIITLRSESDNVFFQLYFHHWILLNESDSSSGGYSASYTRPAYGLTAQCEFVKDAKTNNPLDTDSYIKHEVDSIYFQYYDNIYPYQTDFTTPELEDAVRQLVEGVYAGAPEDTKGADEPFLDGEPLQLYFSAYLVKGIDKTTKKRVKVG